MKSNQFYSKMPVESCLRKDETISETKGCFFTKSLLSKLDSMKRFNNTEVSLKVYEDKFNQRSNYSTNIKSKKKFKEVEKLHHQEIKIINTDTGYGVNLFETNNTEEFNDKNIVTTVHKIGDDSLSNDKMIINNKKSFLISDILGLEKNSDITKNYTELSHKNQKNINEIEKNLKQASNEKHHTIKRSYNNIDNKSSNYFLTKKFKHELLEPDEKNSANKLDNSRASTQSTSSNLWPAWVYCTRYSDRPSAGPRQKRKSKTKGAKLNVRNNIDEGVNTNAFNVFSSSISTSSLSSVCSLESSKINNVSNYEKNRKKKSQNDKSENDNQTVNDGDECVDQDDDADDYDDDNDNDDDDDSKSKRPRTAFTNSQLKRLKDEFDKCRYLTGEKRSYLANELHLNESQIKIWFQNKRAKIKKSSGVKNPLAIQLMAQGLYNHRTLLANNKY